MAASRQRGDVTNTRQTNSREGNTTSHETIMWIPGDRYVRHVTSEIPARSPATIALRTDSSMNPEGEILVHLTRSRPKNGTLSSSLSAYRINFDGIEGYLNLPGDKLRIYHSTPRPGQYIDPKTGVQEDDVVDYLYMSSMRYQGNRPQLTVIEFSGVFTTDSSSRLGSISRRDQGQVWGRWADGSTAGVRLVTEGPLELPSNRQLMRLVAGLPDFTLTFSMRARSPRYIALVQEERSKSNEPHAFADNFTFVGTLNLRTLARRPVDVAEKAVEETEVA